MPLLLDPSEIEMVRSILARNLAPPVRVYAFGSRVHGRALKAFSDLDLCLAPSAIPETVSRLREAFEDSDLPYKVDVVDWSELSPEFREAIQGDLLPLEY